MKDPKKLEIKDTRDDAYFSSATWLGADPSKEVLELTEHIKSEMLLSMWNEYLAFTEGMAIEVYEKQPVEFIKELGSKELLTGFCAYLKGALDISAE